MKIIHGIIFSRDGWPREVGQTQYVDNKTHNRGQDKHIRPPKIGGRVASLVATVAHVKSLMDMSNQWSLSVVW